MTILQQLEARLAAALNTTLGEPISCSVTAAADLRFGDYQSNAAMVLAKQRGKNPRALAQEIISHLDLADLATADIAGPGFINFRILPEAFAARAKALLGDDHLGAPNMGAGRTVVVDFSAPNVAKPMHVGHIRSTIIGDSLCRIARFLGYKVIADNHIGDWGTQFGMILHGWKTLLNKAALEVDPISELLRVYREVNAATKDDPAVLETCKSELVKLQAGDPENLEIWQQCIDVSKRGLQRIYDTLDVKFDHWLGESFYNDRLAGLVDEFLAKGIARESNGAVCIFSDGSCKHEDDPFMVHREDGWTDNPAIIRKADGGFLYATTDLATIRFRIDEWKADQIWYVVGVPQQLHFRQIFAAAQRWGAVADCRHVAFGSILGEDRKLMKTRTGDNVQLTDVLTEAVERAAKLIGEKNPDLKGEEAAEIAEIVGIGAVKFAELSQNRLTDYVFAWDRMLALQGDTAPYLQYSSVRVRSIFRKLDTAFDAASTEIVLRENEEIHLARLHARFGEILPAVLEDFRPNLLANYLLELARAFHSFFEVCPVLKSEESVRSSRLALCELTGRILATGLGLLGIRCPERM
jgi:arginyl-tRNA synthetase